MKNIFIFYVILFALLSSSAQPLTGQRHYCYTDELWAEMVHRDSSLLVKRKEMDANILQFTRNHQRNGGALGAGNSTPSTVIPIVIYVVYDSASVNISMTQIQSQVDQLNQNYLAYGYTFCYATKNVVTSSPFVPQAGDSAGVFRIQSGLSNVDAYSTDAQLKALSTLPSANYLRIFIVHTISPQGVLGYTIWPGTSVANDGIVVLSSVFGSNNYCDTCQLLSDYNQGAVLTHEVGHFLYLYHPFQGGCDTGTGPDACLIYGDQVCDTPPCLGSFGCPNPAPLSCDGIHAELIQNYMDYTDDPCKNSFTAGQKERMDYGTGLYHSNLISTQNLINTGVSCVALGNQYASFYSSNFDGCLNMPMTFASLASQGFTYTWDFGDGNTAVGDTVEHTYSTAGKYLVQLTATNQGGTITATNSNPVFITACQPIECSTNRFDFNYGYLDFTSGTPIATNHLAEAPHFPDGLFYWTFFRGDGHGNASFVIGASQHGQVLYDSSFNAISTFLYGDNYLLFPLPGNKGEYCYIYGLLDTLGSPTDSDVYCIIETAGGAPYVRPDKNNIYFGNSLATFYAPSASPVTAIPDCSGARFWVITMLENNTLQVYETDSAANMTLTGTYDLPQGYSCLGLRASPDGTKILTTYFQAALNDIGFIVLGFDKSNGTISGNTFIDEGESAYYSNYENITCSPTFSPNSRFVYASGPCCTQAGAGTNYVYQYDLQNADPVNSRQALYQYPYNSSNETPIYGYCIGPDQKVYIGHETQPGNLAESYRLSVINFPDTLENGTGNTGFNLNGPDIRPVDCPYSLTQSGFGFFADHMDAFGCNWQPGVPQPFSYQANSCLIYQFYSDPCFQGTWNFGDGASGTDDTSTQSSPLHNFSRPGNYTVQFATGIYTLTDTISIATPAVTIAASPINPCPTPLANYSIAAVQPFVNYSWAITNGLPANAQNQYNVNVAWNTNDTLGTITVFAVNAQTGCADTTTLSVSYLIRDSGIITNTNVNICAGASYTFNNQTLTTSGTYGDTMFTPGGCKSITLLNLNVEQAPVVSWGGGSDTINTALGPVTLTGGSPAGGTYSGTGVNNGVFYPDSTTQGSYTITYTYTDSLGCSNSTSRTFIITGIGAITLENSISVYPNPANNSITVKAGQLSLLGIQISLYDITGRLISVPVEKSAGEESFDISSLAHGIYCLEFLANGKEAVKRFVKMD